VPANEKPWQGGSPEIKSILPRIFLVRHHSWQSSRMWSLLDMAAIAASQISPKDHSQLDCVLGSKTRQGIFRVQKHLATQIL
jgi:glucose-6-phosphate-specific signal transduction histidine kinase